MFLNIFGKPEDYFSFAAAWSALLNMPFTFYAAEHNQVSSQIFFLET